MPEKVSPAEAARRIGALPYLLMLLSVFQPILMDEYAIQPYPLFFEALVAAS
jgi:hypothetical protein